MPSSDQILEMKIKQSSAALGVVLPKSQLERTLEALQDKEDCDDELISATVAQQIKVWTEYLSMRARRNGYYPFILFSKHSYAAFVEYFGDWGFPFMSKHLKNPWRIAPAWAAQFVTALDLLDPDIVAEQSDVYGFVTQSPEFLIEARSERRAFLKYLKAYGQKTDENPKPGRLRLLHEPERRRHRRRRRLKKPQPTGTLIS